MLVQPLDATFGAVVTEVDLTELEADVFTEIYDLWLDRALLIFPGQYLDRDQQNELALRFGELEFEASPLSNVRKDGTIRPDDGSDDMVKLLRGNMGWHHDSTYMPVQAKAAVFTAHVVPSEGGETGWADMRAGYDALDNEMRELVETLSAHHSLYYSSSDIDPGEDSEYSGYGLFEQEPPLRPLVKTHPETGRRSLLIGRHAYGIPDLGPDESERLLARLVDDSCRPPRVHHHRWAAGDAVVWDNRCLMHRARPWDMAEPRVMWHTRIAGDPATEFAAPS